MNQLPILVKREFWEHRTAFLYLPASISLIFIGILIVILMGLASGAGKVDINIDSSWEDNDTHQTEQFVLKDSSLMDLFGVKVQQLAESPEQTRAAQLDRIYTGSIVLWFSVSWFVIFAYLIGTLYNDRRDRSILFWKSMPVSDAMTVLSKLIAGLIVAPGIYFICMVIGHLALTIIASIAAVGMDVDIWETFWVSAHLVTRWLTFVGIYAFALLWCLPFIGWLLLVSSAAKSVPVAWAIGVPVVLIVLESSLIGTSWIGEFIRWHAFTPEFWRYSSDILLGLSLDTSLELAISMVLGMVMIFLAIWQRGRADEI